MSQLPIAIIGAGPVGLAAAAHLLERGETPIVFESGAQVGANIRDWAHIRMFSPWEFTVDSASVRLLEKYNWVMPPAKLLPTGKDLLDEYLIPLAELPEMCPHIQLNARVVAVSRRGVDKMKDAGRKDMPFVLHIAYADGHEDWVEARAVIDASGTWHQPNPVGSGGLPAMGEQKHTAHITYGIPDISGTNLTRYANQRVMVVGSGHSAINALLGLAELKQRYPDTAIIWSMRSDNLARIYGGGEADALPARGALGHRIQEHVQAGDVVIMAPFRIRKIASAKQGIDVFGDTPDGIIDVNVDEIIATTGSRPDLTMLRELRLDIDPSLESSRTLAPMIDPNLHSCGTVPPHGEAELRHPEKDIYIVGMKSYGRAPTFLLATGYEQVRSVVAALAGDWDAARAIELNLPETGVCSTDGLGGAGDACCSAPATTINLDAITLGSERIQLNLLEQTKKSCC